MYQAWPGRVERELGLGDVVGREIERTTEWTGPSVALIRPSHPRIPDTGFLCSAMREPCRRVAMQASTLE
jgi:hypothetical protein